MLQKSRSGRPIGTESLRNEALNNKQAQLNNYITKDKKNKQGVQHLLSYDQFSSRMDDHVRTNIQKQMLLTHHAPTRHTTSNYFSNQDKGHIALDNFRRNLKSVQQPRRQESLQLKREIIDVDTTRLSSVKHARENRPIQFFAKVDSHGAVFRVGHTEQPHDDSLRQHHKKGKGLAHIFQNKLSALKNAFKKSVQVQKHCVQGQYLDQLRAKVQDILDQKYQLLPGNLEDLYSKYLSLGTKHYEYDIRNIEYIHQITLENERLKQELKQTYSQFNTLQKQNQVLVNNIDMLQEKSELVQIKNSSTATQLNFKQLLLDNKFQENYKQLKQLLTIQKLKNETVDIEKIIENQTDMVKQPLINDQQRKIISQLDHVQHENMTKVKEIEELKQEIQKYQYYKQTLEKEKLLFHQQIIDLKDSNVKLQQKYIKFKEIAMMQREEIEDHFVTIKQIKKENHFLTQTVERQALRLDKVIKQKYTQLSLDYVQIQDDIDLIENMKNNKKANAMVYKILEKEFNGINLIEAQNTKKLVQIINDQTVNEDTKPQKLQFFRPPFFTFIYQNYKAEQKMYVLKRDMSISYNFLATLRYIMDAKYNEFLTQPNLRAVSKFPDFVYNWLGKYEYNEKIQRVQNVDPGFINTEKVRIYFYQDIQNPKVQKLWECNIFKQFFDEQALMDEVYFYLHCRYLLFQGPQMKHNNGSFDMIHFTSIEHAVSIVTLVLYKFKTHECDFIVDKIKSKEKAKMKGKTKMLVDSGFVLALLLEYYRNEQKVRTKLLSDLFYSQKFVDLNDTMIMTYTVFKSMVEQNLSMIDDLERAMIYRECFNSGHGKITADIFISVLNEHNYFVKVLKLKTFCQELPSKFNQILFRTDQALTEQNADDKAPTENLSQNLVNTLCQSPNQEMEDDLEMDQTEQMARMFRDINQMLTKHQGHFEYLNNQVASQLGINQVSAQLALAEQTFIQQNSLLKTHDFHAHSFLHFIQGIVDVLCKLVFVSLTHQVVENRTIEFRQVRLFYPIITHLLKILAPQEQKEQDYIRTRHWAALRIQRFFKRTIKKMRDEINNYFKEQIKKAKEKEE